jgi:hypothetical protein
MLSPIARKLINKDFKKLIDAGLMDESLNLTAAGKEEVWLLLFTSFKDKLIERADELLKQ